MTPFRTQTVPLNDAILTEKAPAIDYPSPHLRHLGRHPLHDRHQMGGQSSRTGRLPPRNRLLTNFAFLSKRCEETQGHAKLQP